MIRYFTRVGVALSILLNIIIGGASNQTFSARNWDWKRRGLPHIVWVIDLILGKEHCMQCWVYWKVRKW